MKKQHNDQEKQIARLHEEDLKKTEFFLAASHQLKSPIAIVQWCLQTAVESPTLKGKDREMVLKSLTQADAMAQLITDMLHTFRLMSRKDKVKSYAPVDINTVLDPIIAQYEEIAHRKDVHLVRDPVEALPAIFVDEAYLRQALINLIDNAIKYSNSGTTVTVTTKSVTGGWIEFSVKDHGIGMTEADQSKLFTEFFRSEEARQFAHEGTGLGLVIVKKIIEEFGGELTVKSSLHKGSTFTVKLPAAR